jgi:peptidoglycan/LPS O-acetylase OafA/YrhL
MDTAVTPVKSDYRPDIDGLRALAVLAVIVFHINKHLLPGGFVGVDIFFVISGFLISLHILRDMEAGQFSLVEFYRRRVKRIALPLILVVLAVVIAAQLLMIPADARRAADSALYALLSLANVYFWLFQDTGYFAADSAQTPLLHLWTLGVEEQFYILWPLLLMLVYRRTWARAFMVVAGSAALVSFVFGQLWFQYDPSFVYYMLPSRAGELLLGALLALAVLHGIEKNIPAKAVMPMATVGLLLVAVSLFVLNEEMVFPGMTALPPTLGATLLILAGHCADNRVSRLLQLKPLVAVGLLSYSAYLWHWPLLAFYRYGHAELGAGAALAIFGLTFVLAWLSYRLIERPARASQAPALKLVFMQYLIPAYLIGSIALAVIYLDGFDIRWQTIRDSFSDAASAEVVAVPPSPVVVTSERAIVATSQPTATKSDTHFVDPRLSNRYDKPRAAYQFDYVCQRERASSADIHNQNCVVGDDSIAPPKVILWGDSNAAHYIGVIGEIARKAGFRFRNIEVEACPPLSGDPEPFVFARRVADCRASRELVLPEVATAEVVIISASWSDYAGRSDEFFGQLFATVRSLTEAGKYVLIMAKAPEITGYDWDCHEKAHASASSAECPYTAAPRRYVEEANAKLKAFAAQTRNVGYFDVTPYLCHGGRCSAFDAEGFPIYFDAAHLSLPGSWHLGEEILRKEGIPAPFAQIAERLRARAIQ